MFPNSEGFLYSSFNKRIPFEAFRPEYQEPMKPDQEKFYEDHMPHLEDENKIYGDRGAGAPGNPWMDAGNIVMGGVRGYMGAGGDFGFGSSSSSASAVVGFGTTLYLCSRFGD